MGTTKTDIKTGEIKTKKKRSSKEERARQSMRTEVNKARRKKRYEKWLTKRTTRAKATDGASMGKSEEKNREFKVNAHLHTIRRVVTRNGEIIVEKRSSIGLLKQRLGIPTQWKLPEGWSQSPIVEG